jgi:hypothetical protein
MPKNNWRSGSILSETIHGIVYLEYDWYLALQRGGKG